MAMDLEEQLELRRRLIEAEQENSVLKARIKALESLLVMHGIAPPAPPEIH